MVEHVLVTGGAGYIGSHVSKVLAASGYLPVVLDNLCTGYAEFVQWGPLVKASVDDAQAVDQAIKQYGIRSVIDLAGSIEVAESVADPLKYYENNLARKIAFLRCLSANKVKAIVFSSTAAVYGEPEYVPIPEEHPRNPKNPYGWSKLFYERLLEDFYASGCIPWMALRYFNAAGASLDGEIGEAHEPESHLIPRACFAALGTGPSLDIYGNNYPTPDGTAVRDYVHVMDLAAAHVLAVRQLLEGAQPAQYNLGNGIGTSIGEVLAAFERLGNPVPHQMKPRRVGDPARLVADSAQAKSRLGWKPQYAAVDTIIESAYRWHQKRHAKRAAT